MILVTGGAGFMAQHCDPVISLDKLTYAGNLENLASNKGESGNGGHHIFVQGDIGDRVLVGKEDAPRSPKKPRSPLTACIPPAMPAPATSCAPITTLTAYRC